mmetsp:Transcript_76579/g.169244  ORF Transcript_76579/g.169244 Transcript_76579/m.169244 type:complete len:204 (+) Transcript_76579:437-1048(+)
MKDVSAREFSPSKATFDLQVPLRLIAASQANGTYPAIVRAHRCQSSDLVSRFSKLLHIAWLTRQGHGQRQRPGVSISANLTAFRPDALVVIAFSHGAGVSTIDAAACQGACLSRFDHRNAGRLQKHLFGARCYGAPSSLTYLPQVWSSTSSPRPPAMPFDLSQAFEASRGEGQTFWRRRFGTKSSNEISVPASQLVASPTYAA